jgi:hypothetical protein
MQLNEGGNIFKDAEGKPATQRINQTDVKPTISWLEQLTGLPLADNMLGSTGLKPTSGDLDLAVDPSKISKDQLVNMLTKWAESHGEDPKNWIAKSGTSVHLKTPITGRPNLGYVQTDFMFVPKPDFSKFALRSDQDSEYKGATRNILINSMAKSMGYKLNQLAGIMDRETNELISDDPNKIAKMLLNKNATAEDLRSVESIFDALKNDPNKEAKVADFRAHMEKAGTPIKETVDTEDPNSVHWLARLRDRIVNQGYQVIVESDILEEGVRIEHPEDLVFDRGSAGIDTAIQGIERTAQQPTSATVKWDGKPAIIFGRNPKGEFVLTDKGGFLKSGGVGLATSPKQMSDVLSQRRGGGREELAQLYADLWPVIKKATPNNMQGYLQADLLFHPQKPYELKDGKYVFTPNTVTYRVDANSEIGKKIGDSSFGIVIHSKIAEPGADVDPIQGATISDTPELFVADQNIKDSVAGIQLNDENISQLKQLKSKYGTQIDALFNPQELRDRRISDFPKLFKAYINSKVRAGNYNNMIKDFMSWVDQKTPTKAPRIKQWMQENSQGVAALVQTFLLLSAVKNDMIRQLDQSAHEIAASIDDEPGHEGYVGQDMKFVDRMRFSQANFAKNNPDIQ